MASVYSGAGEGRYGTVTVRGQVEFGLQYNYKAGALEIHVKQVAFEVWLFAKCDFFAFLLSAVQRFGSSGRQTQPQ